MSRPASRRAVQRPRCSSIPSWPGGWATGAAPFFCCFVLFSLFFLFRSSLVAFICLLAPWRTEEGILFFRAVTLTYFYVRRASLVLLILLLLLISFRKCSRLLLFLVTSSFTSSEWIFDFMMDLQQQVS